MKKNMITVISLIYNLNEMSPIVSLQVLDPHDIRFSTWRQQRAAEHLRQQHERHSILPDGSVLIEPYDLPIAHPGDAARHLPPGSVDPFVRKSSPHLRPGDNPESRETRKQV